VDDLVLFKFSASSSKHAEQKAKDILRKHLSWGTLIGVTPVRGCIYEAETSATEHEPLTVKVEAEVSVPVDAPKAKTSTPKSKKGAKPKTKAKTKKR